MHTLTFSGQSSSGQLLDAKTSQRLRAFRFVSERYTQRERPSVAAEFGLLVVIIVTATWPMFTLAHALGLGR